MPEPGQRYRYYFPIRLQPQGKEISTDNFFDKIPFDYDFFFFNLLFFLLHFYLLHYFMSLTFFISDDKFLHLRNRHLLQFYCIKFENFWCSHFPFFGILSVVLLHSVWYLFNFNSIWTKYNRWSTAVTPCILWPPVSVVLSSPR